MRTFITVLKNNYLRTIPRIAAMSVITIITMLTILLAVYVTGIKQVKGRIVLISENPAVAEKITSPYLTVKVAKERPMTGALLQQKYDAFVTVDDQGIFQVESLKSLEYQQLLLQLLQYPDKELPQDNKARGVGVNIIGYMMMFLIVISVANLFAFADDKEQGQLRRISAAPISFTFYLAAQYIYGFSLFLPEYLLLVVIKLCGGNIGFTLTEYALLMGVLALLGISFGLLLHTLIKKPDNATMLGNSLAILSSILAGSFNSLAKENSLLDHIIQFLPQRQLMNYAFHLQNHTSGEKVTSILYVVLISAVLFGIAVKLLNNQYRKAV